MTLFMEEGQVELPIEYESLVRETIECCIDYVNCPYEAEVNVIVTTNDIIHEINMEQRGIDRATDVLSFPMVEWTGIGAFDELEEQFECFNPDSGELMLGDIIISSEKIIEQAKEYGHSLERECSFLIAHSMLHLFGYDHIEEDDRLLMEQAQKEVMKVIGITRE